MINDLVVNNTHRWKYVKDTTNFEILCKGQDIVDQFASRSNANRVQLNIAKCKELCISIFTIDNDLDNDLVVNNPHRWKYVEDTTNFKIICKGQLNVAKCKELCISIFKIDNDFPLLTVGEGTFKVFDSANVLGLNITNDLTRNAHISETIKKVGKRLYSLVQLTRATVLRKDCLLFYVYMLDSRLCLPVFHFALPVYLSQELLECVQIRALQISCPNIDYHCALTIMGLPSISKQHHSIYELTYENIYQDSSNKLNKLIPPINMCTGKMLGVFAVLVLKMCFTLVLLHV